MGSFYRDLGRRIAEVRRQQGLTQERLAERGSITTSYLARIETGARKPTLDVLRRLAGALGVSVSQLLATGRPDELAGRSRDAADEQLLATIRKLPPEDLDLLIEVARRLGRTAFGAAPPASSRAAEPGERKPRP